MFLCPKSFSKGTRQCMLAAEPIGESLFSEKELGFKIFIRLSGDEIWKHAA